MPFAPIQNHYSQRGAQTNAHTSQLNGVLTHPGSFSGTPGYQFALEHGMQVAQRGNAGGRNAGTALARLAPSGNGLAQQEYGNPVDRPGRLSNQQDHFNTTTEQNRLTGENGTNQFNPTGQRDHNTFTTNQQQNANTATRHANDFSLGQDQNNNIAQNNSWTAQNNAGRKQNDFNLGLGQNANPRDGKLNNFPLLLFFDWLV